MACGGACFKLPLKKASLTSDNRIYVPVTIARGLLAGVELSQGPHRVADVRAEDAGGTCTSACLRTRLHHSCQQFNLHGLSTWLKARDPQDDDVLVIWRAPDAAATSAAAAALPVLMVALQQQSARPAPARQGQVQTAAAAGADERAARSPPGEGRSSSSGGSGQAASSVEPADPDDVPLAARVTVVRHRQRASAAASATPGALTAKRAAGAVGLDAGPPAKRTVLRPGAAALGAAKAACEGAPCLPPQEQQPQERQEQQQQQQRQAQPLFVPFAAAAHAPAAAKPAPPARAGLLPAASLIHLHGCAPPELGLPPLRPGELRLCGVTYHPDVAPAVRQGMEDWQSRLPNGDLAAADSVAAQMSVEGLGSGAGWWCQRFRQHKLKRGRILNCVARMLKLSGEGGSCAAPLPEGPVEMPGALRRCAGAAAGGAGAPAGSVSCVEAQPKSAALCLIGGYALPTAAAEEFAAAGYTHVPPAVQKHVPRQQGQPLASAWRAFVASQCVPYAADAGAALAPLPSADGAGGVVLCMLGYGGVAALVAEADEATPANCMAVPVCVRGLKLMVLVALRDIAAGERLVCDWGAAEVRQRLQPAAGAAACGAAVGSVQPVPAPASGAPAASTAAAGAAAGSGRVAPLPSAGAPRGGAGPTAAPAAALPSELAESEWGPAARLRAHGAGRDRPTGGVGDARRTRDRHGGEHTSDCGTASPSRRRDRGPRRSRSRCRDPRHSGDAGGWGSELRRSSDRSRRSPQRRRSRSRSRSRSRTHSGDRGVTRASASTVDGKASQCGQESQADPRLKQPPPNPAVTVPTPAQPLTPSPVASPRPTAPGAVQPPQEERLHQQVQQREERGQNANRRAIGAARWGPPAVAHGADSAVCPASGGHTPALPLPPQRRRSEPAQSVGAAAAGGTWEEVEAAPIPVVAATAAQPAAPGSSAPPLAIRHNKLPAIRLVPSSKLLASPGPNTQAQAPVAGLQQQQQQQQQRLGAPSAPTGTSHPADAPVGSGAQPVLRPVLAVPQLSARPTHAPLPTSHKCGLRCGGEALRLDVHGNSKPLALRPLIEDLAECLGLGKPMQEQVSGPLHNLGMAAVVALHQLERDHGVPFVSGAVLRVACVPVAGLKLRCTLPASAKFPTWGDVRATALFGELQDNLQHVRADPRRDLTTWVYSLATITPTVLLQLETSAPPAAGRTLPPMQRVPLHAEAEEQYRAIVGRPIARLPKLPPPLAAAAASPAGRTPAPATAPAQQPPHAAAHAPTTAYSAGWAPRPQQQPAPYYPPAGPAWGPGAGPQSGGHQLQPSWARGPGAPHAAHAHAAHAATYYAPYAYPHGPQPAAALPRPTAEAEAPYSWPHALRGAAPMVVIVEEESDHESDKTECAPGVEPVFEAPLTACGSQLAPPPAAEAAEGQQQQAPVAAAACGGAEGG